MSPNFELPAWLEAFRPDDELYARAYEETPAPLRALLKTAMAFAFHRFGMQDDESESSFSCARAGFSRTEYARPAAWALAVTGADFASPARFLAATVPAVLAGVPRVLVVSASPFAPPVAAALELAGLEDSFLMDAEGLASLYEDLRAFSPEGRVMLFPGPEGCDAGMKDLLHTAVSDGTAVYRDRGAPRILSLYKGEGGNGVPSAAEVEKRLLWMHPDAELLDAPAPGAGAVFTPEPSAAPCRAPLIAGPGMEGLWTGPSPEFFRTGALCAQLVQEIPS